MWSALDLGLIIALAAFDGGGDSAFVGLLVIPIVFAAVSYPRTLVIGISVATILGYLLLAALTDTAGGYMLMFSATLGATALMCVWQARNHERRRELLAIASRTDPLTGALNRRGFQLAASTLLAGVTRLGFPASIVLLDLDNFKHFNDSNGHAAGDELLCWSVERIRSSLRPTDSLARLGGDEFAVLLAGADRPAAQAAVRRITEDLITRVETSCGLASAPGDGADIDALYRQADAELYEAKRARHDDSGVTRLPSAG
jgi:diguanylate cyclase (GGDEF)-like protein